MADGTMRAVSYDRYGGPELLRLTELPVPKVGPGEVLVRVRSAAVNPVDWKIMSGGLDALLEIVFPAVPGWDVAGVVERVGLDVPELAVGDEVIAYARKDWVHGGTFAELVTVPVRAVARKPRSVGWDEAAGLPLAGLTAYQALTRLGLGAGETVLVHGAAGGVGSLGVQIARAFGARVIGTASQRNHPRLRALGVEPVTYGAGLRDRVRALAPEGVDVVADFVGGVVEDTTAVLRHGGRHASVADPAAAAEGGQWMWVRPDRDDLGALADLVDDGRLRIPVAEVFGLDDVAAAFRSSMGGHTAGKIAIRVSEDAS